MTKRQASTKSRTIERVNNYARSKGPRALEIINSIMEDEEAPIPVRLKAAEMILDRGVGKPTQKSEATVEVSVQQMHLVAIRDAATLRLDNQGIKPKLIEQGQTIDYIDEGNNLL